MGKRKKSAQRRMIRENDAFDMIERGEEPKNVKNEPKTIYSGKKLKKKLKARGKQHTNTKMKLMVDDIAMDEVKAPKYVIPII